MQVDAVTEVEVDEAGEGFQREEVHEPVQTEPAALTQPQGAQTRQVLQGNVNRVSYPNRLKGT